VQIIEYAPLKFSKIREIDGIDQYKIRKSLSVKYNRDAVFNAGESAGKSGSFFFFSHNREFLIKTMNSGEMELFMELFPDYYNHIIDADKSNNMSLLARIYGVFTVKMEDIEPVHILMMANNV
jgi:1-phosphatidylinositol-4-phosphate 5-kinase